MLNPTQEPQQPKMSTIPKCPQTAPKHNADPKKQGNPPTKQQTQHSHHQKSQQLGSQGARQKSYTLINNQAGVDGHIGTGEVGPCGDPYQAMNVKDPNNRNRINQHIKNLTNKLKQIHRKKPTLDSVDSIAEIKQQQKQKQQTLHSENRSKKAKSNRKEYIDRLHLQIQLQRQNYINQKYDASKKQKVKWNQSASGWTREKSPSHKIPQAKRFPDLDDMNNIMKDKQKERHVEETSDRWSRSKNVQASIYMDGELRSSLEKTGISFARSPRRQLFKKQLITPSPHDYNLKRYLQNLCQNPKPYIAYHAHPSSQLGQSLQSGYLSQQIQHIKGGMIPKFKKHVNLYYPHTKKLNYNEKIIEEMRETHNRERRRRVGAESVGDGTVWRWNGGTGGTPRLEGQSGGRYKHYSVNDRNKLVSI